MQKEFNVTESLNSICPCIRVMELSSGSNLLCPSHKEGSEEQAAWHRVAAQLAPAELLMFQSCAQLSILRHSVISASTQ